MMLEVISEGGLQASARFRVIQCASLELLLWQEAELLC